MSWWKRTVDRVAAAPQQRAAAHRDREAAVAGARPIAEANPREKVIVAGRIDQTRLNDDCHRFEALLADGTGSLWLVFLGRHAVDGVVPGAQVKAEGRTCAVNGTLGIFNPRYELLDG